MKSHCHIVMQFRMNFSWYLNVKTKALNYLSQWPFLSYLRPTTHPCLSSMVNILLEWLPLAQHIVNSPVSSTRPAECHGQPVTLLMQQMVSGQPFGGLVQDFHPMLDVSSLLRLSAAGDQLKEEEREGKGPVSGPRFSLHCSGRSPMWHSSRPFIPCEQNHVSSFYFYLF